MGSQVTLPALRGLQEDGERQRHDIFQTSLRVLEMLKWSRNDSFLPGGQEKPHWCCALGAGGLWMGEWGRGQHYWQLQEVWSGEDAHGPGKEVQTSSNISERKKKPTKQEINLKSSNFSFLQIRASQNKPEKRESYHFQLPSFSKLRNILIYHPLPERTSSPNKELSFKVGLIKKNQEILIFHFATDPKNLANEAALFA